jgi:CO/xanthine dehydrogenase Mo-binding subunit
VFDCFIAIALRDAGFRSGWLFARGTASKATSYDPINFTYPAGAYIAEVEIDRETGTVELVNFTGADDFGRIINPLIVEGQVHGGLVQGIGQALYENAVYDESSQLKNPQQNRHFSDVKRCARYVRH